MVLRIENIVNFIKLYKGLFLSLLLMKFISEGNFLLDIFKNIFKENARKAGKISRFKINYFDNLGLFLSKENVLV